MDGSQMETTLMLFLFFFLIYLKQLGCFRSLPAHHFTLLGKTFKVKDSPLLFSHQKQPETLGPQIQKF